MVTKIWTSGIFEFEGQEPIWMSTGETILDVASSGNPMVFGRTGCVTWQIGEDELRPKNCTLFDTSFICEAPFEKFE